MASIFYNIGLQNNIRLIRKINHFPLNLGLKNLIRFIRGVVLYASIYGKFIWENLVLVFLFSKAAVYLRDWVSTPELFEGLLS